MRKAPNAIEDLLAGKGMVLEGVFMETEVRSVAAVADLSNLGVGVNFDAASRRSPLAALIALYCDMFPDCIGRHLELHRRNLANRRISMPQQ